MPTTLPIQERPGHGIRPPQGPEEWGGHGGEPDPYRGPGGPLSLHQIGVAIALVSITAFFGALVTVYYFRLEREVEWQRVHIPRLLWVSSVFLLLSSITLEHARQTLRYGRDHVYRRDLGLTLGLGVAFLLSQAVAWRDLLSQGVTVVANPHGSMFYAFLGLHGLHLLAGMAYLLYLVRHARLLPGATEQERRHERVVARAAATYWHSMGILWIALFGLLYYWR